jgi:uncharacterized protein
LDNESHRRGNSGMLTSNGKFWTRQRKWKWIRALVLLLLLYVILHWFEHSQVYFPTKRLAAEAVTLGRPYEDVYFKARDGVQLNGWFFPASTNSSRSRLAILLFHGNAGNIGDRLDHFKILLTTGANLFAIDYHGYGRSGGKPGEAATYLDGLAAHGWLVQRGFAPTNIIALGESLGGGVASELALGEPLGGLILQSTYTSIPAVGAELFPWLPVRLLATIKYDTCAKLPHIHVPVLILHSRGDTMIRFHHAEQNFAAANEPKMIWELQGDHNDALEARAQYLEGLEKFLRLIETGVPRTQAR